MWLRCGGGDKTLGIWVINIEVWSSTFRILPGYLTHFNPRNTPPNQSVLSLSNCATNALTILPIILTQTFFFQYMYVPILNTVQAQRLVSFLSMVLKRPSLTWVCYFRFEGANGFLVRENQCLWCSRPCRPRLTNGVCFPGHTLNGPVTPDGYYTTFTTPVPSNVCTDSAISSVPVFTKCGVHPIGPTIPMVFPQTMRHPRLAPVPAEGTDAIVP